MAGPGRPPVTLAPTDADILKTDLAGMPLAGPVLMAAGTAGVLDDLDLHRRRVALLALLDRGQNDLAARGAARLDAAVDALDLDGLAGVDGAAPLERLLGCCRRQCQGE